MPSSCAISSASFRFEEPENTAILLRFSISAVMRVLLRIASQLFIRKSFYLAEKEKASWHANPL